MIYKGKTTKLANISTYHTGIISGETSSTLTIDGELEKGASRTTPRANVYYTTLKSWSIDGEITFNIAQFIAFWHWMTTNEDCQLAFSNSKISVSGQVIITYMKINAQINSVVRLQFKAIGTGKPDIQYF